MLIMSQSRTLAVNANKVHCLFVRQFCVYADAGENSTELLGAYQTEDRAKEVFKELSDSCASDNPAYYLPEE